MPISCPCGSQQPYSSCCKRYIEEEHIPKLPVELMKSRYSAYCLGNLGYIQQTMTGPALKGFDLQQAQEQQSQITWTQLDIIDFEPVVQKETISFVEFKAQYLFQGSTHILHEKSRFQFISDRWFYTDGIINP